MLKPKKISDLTVEEHGSEITEHLYGTCNSLGSFLSELYDLEEDDMEIPIEVMNHIDMEIFLCGTCGWWYESHEEAGEKSERICEDCAEDE